MILWFEIRPGLLYSLHIQQPIPKMAASSYNCYIPRDTIQCNVVLTECALENNHNPTSIGTRKYEY